MSQATKKSRPSKSSLVMGSLRERGTIVLVGALTGLYGAVMVVGSNILTVLSGAGAGPVGPMLGAVSTVFIGIALYVGGVVISGCVSTVITGRLRDIATLRLLGSTAKQLRRGVASASARAAAVGAIGGTVLGLIICAIARAIMISRHQLPDADYAFAPWQTLIVIVAVMLMARVAGHVGSRKVLAVTPAAAFSNMGAGESAPVRRLRLALALLLTVLAIAGLTLASLGGESQGAASSFFLAFLSSITLLTGLIAGAPWFVPALVRLTSRLAGRSPAARIAARNAVADPQRTARSTVGLIIGVALVVTFMSGAASLSKSIETWTDLSPENRQQAVNILTMMGRLLTAIVVVSSVIAAVGFVSTMSLVVLQRRREIGLLRALGLTTSEVRRMVTIESLALGATAVLFGTALGVLFGTLGAQSLIGFMNDGLIVGLPWTTTAIVAACGLVLVLCAALPPARRANRVSVVDALAHT